MSNGTGPGDPSIQLSGRTIPSPAAIHKTDSSNEAANVEVRVPILDVAELSEPTYSRLASFNEIDTQMISHCDIDNTKTTSHFEAMNEDKIEYEHQTEENSIDQNKLLKKPDKILPCPRCNSSNTKFCYYNNCNVNQPRHFCKNCQRYWTAGGTMRNVPVGSGKRKSKNSSQHRQIALSNDRTACMQPSDMSSLKENGNILEASVKENGKNDTPSYPTQSLNCAENNHCENTASLDQNCTNCHSNGLPSVNPLHVFPFAPWMCPWPPGWFNNPMMPGMWPSELVYMPENAGLNTVSCHPLQMPFSPYSMPGLPFPFFPASFWGGMTSWPDGTLNGSFAKPKNSLTPSSFTANSQCSQNRSSTLGKHFRDATSQGEPEKEKYLWVPKTLRINDPDEAAKSSIWETLGIKPDESIIKGGIFKSLNSKSENKEQSSDAAFILRANPAALSRSHAFQEST